MIEWLRPILLSVTLLYFDDIWSFHENPNYSELATINKFNEAYEYQLIPFSLLGNVGA